MITSAIGTFGTRLEVIRRPTVERFKGRSSEADNGKRFEIFAIVQPPSNKELQRLPEGQRNQAVIAIVTDQELQTGDVDSTRPDRVIPRGKVYCGVEFEINALAPWPSHNRYLAIKVGP